MLRVFVHTHYFVQYNRSRAGANAECRARRVSISHISHFSRPRPHRPQLLSQLRFQRGVSLAARCSFPHRSLFPLFSANSRLPPPHSWPHPSRPQPPRRFKRSCSKWCHFGLGRSATALSPTLQSKADNCRHQGDASSPASFEKTLSALSAKITDTQCRLDQRRSSARRAKVLWTLYLSFAYLVYAIVLLLVVGYGNMGLYEWTGMAGGPVV